MNTEERYRKAQKDLFEAKLAWEKEKFFEDKIYWKDSSDGGSFNMSVTKTFYGEARRQPMLTQAEKVVVWENYEMITRKG